MLIDTVIGVDAGSNGGIAVYKVNDKENVIQVCKMPKDIIDFRDYIKYLIKDCGRHPIAFIEKVGTIPPDLMQGGKIFRIKQLEKNYTELKATLDFFDIPTCIVTPQKWQKTLNLVIKGEEKKERKNRYKGVAQNLYPKVKATLWNCDALLIMHFGRYMLVNDKDWIMHNMQERIMQKISQE